MSELETLQSLDRLLQGASAKGCLSRETALAMVFKLVGQAPLAPTEPIRALAQIIRGVRFRDGEPAAAAEDEPAA